MARITVGLMRWLSICWTTMATTPAHSPVETESVIVPTKKPSTPPTHGPTKGMMLRNPEIMPRTSQKSSPISQKPKLIRTPTMKATRSWPLRKPPMTPPTSVETYTVSTR